jgi:hypothetical protein
MPARHRVYARGRAAFLCPRALNGLSLWPWMLGRERIPVPDEELIEEIIRMFLQHYGAAPAKKVRPQGTARS